MNLKELLIQKIHALYDMENELVKALTMLTAAVTSQELKEALREHLAETRTHCVRLGQAHKLLRVKPKKLKVEGIRGIIADARWVVKNVTDKSAADANIVRAVQYAEHYEIAGYMGAIAWAHTLGKTKLASVLRETLREEEKGDKILAAIGKKLDNKIC